tara:strand:- start:102 stop:440 length:339 start_codon:yes stop_codon:yes gene_type:complete
LYLQVLVDASNDVVQSDRTDGFPILIGKERGVDHTGDERAHVDDATGRNNSCTKASSSGVQILVAAASESDVHLGVRTIGSVRAAFAYEQRVGAEALKSGVAFAGIPSTVTA